MQDRHCRSDRLNSASRQLSSGTDRRSGLWRGAVVRAERRPPVGHVGDDHRSGQRSVDVVGIEAVSTVLAGASVASRDDLEGKAGIASQRLEERAVHRRVGRPEPAGRRPPASSSGTGMMYLILMLGLLGAAPPRVTRN